MKPTVAVRASLIVGALFSSALVAAKQEPSVLRINVSVVTAERQVLPVPRHALLISDNPPSAAPRRVLTALDGSVSVRLRPGTYTVESDQPFPFEGKGYQWTQNIDVVAGRDAVLDLTGGNAEIAPLSAETLPSAAAPPAAGSSSLMARWQNSLVAIWTPTTHASGFVIDPSGLIVSNQRGVGTATSVEVQITASLKVTGHILATDAARDVAAIRVDAAAIATLPAVPLGCGQTAPALVKGQEIVALEAPLRRQKDMTNGVVESIATRAIASDLSVASGGAGGPVFAMDGTVVGMTSALERPDQRQPDYRVVRVADICEVVASAERKMKESTPPSATQLPVEPAKSYPVDTLKDAAARRAGRLNPYKISSADFDVSILTPVLSYASQERLGERFGPAQGGDQRRASVESALGQLLADFANWSEYVADFPPVLLVRVTPKLVESLWAKIARGAAQTQGVSLPPLKRFGSGFSRLRAFCGETEITPIHPFKLEHRVSQTDVIYEGLYAFDPDAIGPHCASVKLMLYSDNEPQKGDARIVDSSIVKQIWQDFESYRALR